MYYSQDLKNQIIAITRIHPFAELGHMLAFGTSGVLLRNRIRTNQQKLQFHAFLKRLSCAGNALHKLIDFSAGCPACELWTSIVMIGNDWPAL